MITSEDFYGRASYTYNGEGYRVEKNTNGKTTWYLYEGDKAVLEVSLETDPSGRRVQTSSWNVYGINLISRLSTGQQAYYLYNGHGDVTALMDGLGNTLGTYCYDAFGNILESTGSTYNPYRYGGYRYDSGTGLYYLNSRMYDPVTARFLQEDTYSGDVNDPLSLNLYTYCHNEPIMYVDPTGHKAESMSGDLSSGRHYVPSIPFQIKKSLSYSAVSSQKSTIIVVNVPAGCSSVQPIQQKSTDDMTSQTSGTLVSIDNINIFSEYNNPILKANNLLLGNSIKKYMGSKKNEVKDNSQKIISSKQDSLESSLKSGLSMGIGMVPILGDLKDIQEAVTGQDLITGEKLTVTGRIITIACALIPVVNGKSVREILKIANEGIEEIPKISDDIIDDMIKSTDEVDTTVINNECIVQVESNTASTIDEIGNVTKPYEVGFFNDLKARSIVGDGLDIHHVSQKQAAMQVIPGYNPLTAPSIAIPHEMHIEIPTMKGTFLGNARSLLANDIRNLRKYTDVSNSALRELIDLNKTSYPNAFMKLGGSTN